MSFLNDMPVPHVDGHHTPPASKAMLTGLKILIVEEEEYLIALDIERIVLAAGAKSATVARGAAEALELMEAGERFDLAIIEMPREGTQADSLARQLQANDSALVVCSADSLARAEIGQLGEVPVVAKPFAEEDLLAGCGEALGNLGRCPTAPIS